MNSLRRSGAVGTRDRLCSERSVDKHPDGPSPIDNARRLRWRRLLKELPKAGEVWPEDQRKLWLDTAASIFKMIYKDSPNKLPLPPYMKEAAN